MIERPGRIVVLAVVVAIAGAAVGATTTAYLADSEDVDYSVTMPEDPVANAASTNPIDEGGTVTLTGVDSTDDGRITAYEWDFGADGSLDAAGMNQTRTYNDSGTYQVRLVVTDATGLTDNATRTVTVRNVPPSADAGSDVTVEFGTAVTFDASGTTDPGADELSYTWDFGDGETGSGVSPTHTFGTDGTHTVTLTVRDGDGGNDTDTVTVTVRNARPTADAGEDVETVIGTPVEFDGAGSHDPDGDDLTYRWDVDADGTFDLSGPTPRYRYEYGESGSYTAILRVTDDDGAVDTDTVNVTVESEPGPERRATDDNESGSPVAEFVVSSTRVSVGQQVRFDASHSTDDGSIESYDWAFGDNTTASGPTTTHAYATPGVYEVTLEVTDAAGNTDTHTERVVVRASVAQSQGTGQNGTQSRG